MYSSEIDISPYHGYCSAYFCHCKAVQSKGDQMFRRNVNIMCNFQIWELCFRKELSVPYVWGLIRVINIKI
jgi:hypothetical protein